MNALSFCVLCVKKTSKYDDLFSYFLELSFIHNIKRTFSTLRVSSFEYIICMILSSESNLTFAFADISR